jgi:hypothetical protein
MKEKLMRRLQEEGILAESQTMRHIELAKLLQRYAYSRECVRFWRPRTLNFMLSLDDSSGVIINQIQDHLNVWLDSLPLFV